MQERERERGQNLLFIEIRSNNNHENSVNLSIPLHTNKKSLKAKKKLFKYSFICVYASYGL